MAIYSYVQFLEHLVRAMAVLHKRITLTDRLQTNALPHVVHLGQVLDPLGDDSAQDDRLCKLCGHIFAEGLIVAGEITKFDEEITVMFETAGLKRLAVSFANLEVLT